MIFDKTNFVAYILAQHLHKLSFKYETIWMIYRKVTEDFIHVLQSSDFMKKPSERSSIDLWLPILSYVGFRSRQACIVVKILGGVLYYNYYHFVALSFLYVLSVAESVLVK